MGGGDVAARLSAADGIGAATVGGALLGTGPDMAGDVGIGVLPAGGARGWSPAVITTWAAGAVAGVTTPLADGMTAPGIGVAATRPTADAGVPAAEPTGPPALGAMPAAGAEVMIGAPAWLTWAPAPVGGLSTGGEEGTAAAGTGLAATACVAGKAVVEPGRAACRFSSSAPPSACRTAGGRTAAIRPAATDSWKRPDDRIASATRSGVTLPSPRRKASTRLIAVFTVSGRSGASASSASVA